jgi:tRNA-guanine family transglycosylase
MVLDECLAFPATHVPREFDASIGAMGDGASAYAGLRSKPVDGVSLSNAAQAQFGIVQGGVFDDLRHEAPGDGDRGVRGYAIGGLASENPSSNVCGRG